MAILCSVIGWIVGAAHPQGILPQEIASRDLSNPSVKSTLKDRQAEQLARCGDRVRARVADGEVAPQLGTPPDEFELTIVGVEPALLINGGDFLVTVRLKNAGRASVAVPWEPDPGKIRDSEAAEERGFQEAWIGLSLRTGRHSQELPSGFALYASFDKSWSLVQLKPGEWITLKVRSALRCPKNDDSCKGISARGTVQLVANWTRIFQQIKTSDCSFDQSTFQDGRAVSAPVRVTILDVPININ